MDQPTGRKFYVNHELKAISWDRPRASRADSTVASRSLSQSINGMSSSGDGRARSTNVRSRSGSAAVSFSMTGVAVAMSCCTGRPFTFAPFPQPPLLNRNQANSSSRRRDTSVENVARRYTTSDRMGRSMDGSYYQGEEKRRAEMQVLTCCIFRQICYESASKIECFSNRKNIHTRCGCQDAAAQYGAAIW